MGTEDASAKQSIEGVDAPAPFEASKLPEENWANVYMVNAATVDLVRGLLTEPNINGYLEALHEYDPDDTYPHSLRNAVLAVDVGRDCDLSPQELKTIGRAGLLHDIGKVGMEFLKENRVLTDDERRRMEEHVAVAFDLLKDEPNLADTRKVLMLHHEFRAERPYRRSGVERRKVNREPSGSIKWGQKRSGGDQRDIDPRILKMGEILAAADTFDAMGKRGGYKTFFPPDEIRNRMRVEFTGDQTLVEQLIQRQLPRAA